MVISRPSARPICGAGSGITTSRLPRSGRRLAAGSRPRSRSITVRLEQLLSVPCRGRCGSCCRGGRAARAWRGGCRTRELATARPGGYRNRSGRASAGTVRWPPVTVIVATRDRPALLERAVRSVLSQSYPGDIECVVVFDQSSPAAVPWRRTRAAAAEADDQHAQLRAWQAPATAGSSPAMPPSSPSAMMTTNGTSTSSGSRSSCFSHRRQTLSAAACAFITSEPGHSPDATAVG